MTRPLSSPNQGATGEAGVAAIEFALVFPVLLLLFFGLINITQYVSQVRKVSAASQLVSDLVARQKDGTINVTTLDDYFTAVELLYNPREQNWVQTNVGIVVYTYAAGSNPALVRWTRLYGDGARCAVPPVNANDPVARLLPTSDVVVVVVCTTFAEPVANFPGLLSLANRRIESMSFQRPRESDTLTCTDCKTKN